MDVNDPNFPRIPPPPSHTFGSQPVPFLDDLGMVGQSPNGSPAPSRTPIWLWVVTLALLITGIWMQRPEPEDPTVIQKEAAGLGDIKAPKASGFVLIGKVI